MPERHVPHFPVLALAAIPTVDAAGMAEVDRLMVGPYGIGIARMMELAGRHLADLARVRFLAGDPVGKSVVVLAGVGGNGGGALVAARRLAGWEARVTVFLSRAPADIAGIAAEQLAILANLGIAGSDRPGDPADLARAAGAADVIVDGLIGYSLKGAPRGLTGALIAAVADADPNVLSLDLPSGLDATTGEAHPPTVRAAATMTLALPKTGLAAAAARPYVGALYLADIGVPPALYAEPSLKLDVPPLFARADIVRLEA